MIFRNFGIGIPVGYQRGDIWVSPTSRGPATSPSGWRWARRPGVSRSAWTSAPARYRRARATAHRVGRQLVAAYTSCPPDRQAWERDARGRPLVVEPGGLHVSLSHAEAVVAAAVSRAAPVGVDVERLRPLADRGALARTALSEAELKAVDELPEAHRDAQVLRFWTRKEAVAKALGTGLTTEPARHRHDDARRGGVASGPVRRHLWVVAGRPCGPGRGDRFRHGPGAGCPGRDPDTRTPRGRGPIRPERQRRSRPGVPW